MRVDIYPIHPDNIRFLSSKTVDLLKAAHDPFFGDFDALDQARESKGVIYEVRTAEDNSSIIVGAFYLKFRFNHLGKVMDLQYLGGEINAFRAELSAFLWDLADKERADELVYVGRRGFGRLFPWMQEVGSVYRCKRVKGSKVADGF